MQRSICIIAVSICLFSVTKEFHMALADQLNDVPVAAPIDTDSAGRGGDIATHSVVRVICLDNSSGGTGFLHKSGNIITANHVVRNGNDLCQKLLLILPDATRMEATIIATDIDHDLAVISPATALTASPLKIASTNDFKVGTQVSTWGFPAGYFGLSPMLSVGYLAGIDAAQLPGGKLSASGSSTPRSTGAILAARLFKSKPAKSLAWFQANWLPSLQSRPRFFELLINQKYGMMYSGKKADGSDFQVSESSLVGRVLDELRRQVQLVIGKAVMLEDLKAFLAANKIDP